MPDSWRQRRCRRAKHWRESSPHPCTGATSGCLRFRIGSVPCIWSGRMARSIDGPADNPITKDAELRQALGPEVTVVRDNNWYNAAIASVGSLGIVYSVILEVREAYKMTVSRSTDKWTRVRPRLADGSLSMTASPTQCTFRLIPAQAWPAVTLTAMSPQGCPSRTLSRRRPRQQTLCPRGSPPSAITISFFRSPIVWQPPHRRFTVPYRGSGRRAWRRSRRPVLVPLVAALTPVVATAALAVPILTSILKAAAPARSGTSLESCWTNTQTRLPN